MNMFELFQYMIGSFFFKVQVYELSLEHEHCLSFLYAYSLDS